MSLSNLPPGTTDHMIEEAAGAFDEDDQMSDRNQWYGVEFCPHPGAPCIDGCSFCGARLAIDDHNHTRSSKQGQPERYECVCFNC